MRRLFLILPISAVLIGGLAAFKLTRQYEPLTSRDYEKPPPAPRFLLADEHSRIVRLERYLGRQKILVVFFDGTNGPDGSPLVSTLKDRYADLKRTGAAILAISASRPAQNRYGANLERRKSATADQAEELHYPFPLLSDIVEYDVHKRYGAFDEQANTPREGIFVIDRTGLIQYSHLGPDQLGTIDDWVRELRDVR
ncbi:MAG: redoxin domain-containing protein [Planctomycetes bacterium]|nr:redoxin domain-containing protein [Planctomycetota bacterium]